MSEVLFCDVQDLFFRDADFVGLRVVAATLLEYFYPRQKTPEQTTTIVGYVERMLRL